MATELHEYVLDTKMTAVDGMEGWTTCPGDPEQAREVNILVVFNRDPVIKFWRASGAASADMIAWLLDDTAPSCRVEFDTSVYDDDDVERDIYELWVKMF